jgi:predicted RNA-binding protein YlqC (UPF0109 family)
MNDLIIRMAQLLAEHPGDVQLVELTGAQTSIYEIRCHADDVGKIIGKNGKTIAAMRALAGAVAQKAGKRAVLEVIQ